MEDFLIAWGSPIVLVMGIGALFVWANFGKVDVE
ncbi:cytochrome bd oxidase small subunit CydS [Exiguobacterium sp. TDN 0502]